jgi:TolA-binding protein
MVGVEEEIRDIKREIVESRALLIKTNNLANALGADLKSISKRQQGYEKRLSWNSATAYVVFVIVVFAALKFAWDARVDQVKSETEQKSLDLARVQKELKDALRRDEDRARAEAKAAQFYELIRGNKRQDVVEQYDLIKKEPLSRAEAAFFSDSVERARNELVTTLYLQGLDRIRIQRWQEAVTVLEEAQRQKEDSTFAPRIRLRLGECYRHLNRQKDAVAILTQLAEGTFERDIQDDALYHLAWSQMDLSAWDDAKSSWRSLLRKFPDSRYAAEAKLQIAQLQALH